jgi:predicted nucleic acid-binding protein
LIDEIEILPQIYGNVIIPKAVFEELKADAAPGKVKEWLRDLPGWLEVRIVSSQIDAELIEMLGEGEAEAIQLARELNADLLVIDETLGREIAVRHGLRIIGTIGVLSLANKKRLNRCGKSSSKTGPNKLLRFAEA